MESTSSYLDLITSYYLENLPEPLQKVFVPQQKITLSLEEMCAISYSFGIPGVISTVKTTSLLAAVSIKIKNTIAAFENRCFVRLGSRSPKDSPLFSLPCKKYSDVLDTLFFSKRVFEDIQWAQLYDYPISIFLRPWLVINKWQEFRCIIMDGKIYGISQYYVFDRSSFREIMNAPQKIAHELVIFLQDFVLPHAQHQNYVCDILYTEKAVQLLDYNPIVNKTGLCFFASNYSPPAKAEFRFMGEHRLLALDLNC